MQLVFKVLKIMCFPFGLLGLCSGVLFVVIPLVVAILPFSWPVGVIFDKLGWFHPHPFLWAWGITTIVVGLLYFCIMTRELRRREKEAKLKNAKDQKKQADIENKKQPRKNIPKESLDSSTPEQTNKPVEYAVVDTSWLMEIGRMFEAMEISWEDTKEVVDAVFREEKLKNLRLVVPRSVLRELDGLKKEKDGDGRPTGRARQAIRASMVLELLSRKFDFRRLEFWEDRGIKVRGYLESEVDQVVVEVAREVKKMVREYGGGRHRVWLLTTDRNQKILAASYGISAWEKESLLEEIEAQIDKFAKSGKVWWYSGYSIATTVKSIKPNDVNYKHNNYAESKANIRNKIALKKSVDCEDGPTCTCGRCLAVYGLWDDD